MYIREDVGAAKTAKNRPAERVKEVHKNRSSRSSGRVWVILSSRSLPREGRTCVTESGEISEFFPAQPFSPLPSYNVSRCFSFFPRPAIHIDIYRIQIYIQGQREIRIRENALYGSPILLHTSDSVYSSFPPCGLQQPACIYVYLYSA